MYIVKCSAIEQFAYNFPDAVSQANQLAALYGEAARVKPVGSDEVSYTAYSGPSRELLGVR